MTSSGRLSGSARDGAARDENCIIILLKIFLSELQKSL
jgi:hypothetical protein